ncbi:MAG TPA: type II secretion system protein [Polyangia bacterium]
MRAAPFPTGFTLIELMVVIAIIAIMTVAAMFSLSGYGKAQDPAALARGVQLMMIRARGDALADNHQRELSCTTAGCTYFSANTAWTGSGACPGAVSPCWVDAGDRVQTGNRALLFDIDSTTDYKTSTPGTQLTSAQTKTITFRPDGTATPATVYISDGNGNNAFKVYVFAGTGMARLVSGW